MSAAAWVGIALAESAPSPKPTAQPSTSEPDNTTASFGDWVLHCVRTEPATKTCELLQTLEVKGQGTVAQIAIGRTSPKSPLLLSALLPVNASFPSVVRFAVDDKDASPVELPWRYCAPGGCFAQAELKAETEKVWRGQTGPGQIRFEAANRQAITMGFSFKGFASALDALLKTSASP